MPSHIRGNAEAIRFGDVFDLPKLRRALGKPVIEWDDVRDVDSPNYDILGCWNLWAVVNKDIESPRGSYLTEWIGLGEHFSFPAFVFTVC
jgi:hypothetical protein